MSRTTCTTIDNAKLSTSAFPTNYPELLVSIGMSALPTLRKYGVGEEFLPKALFEMAESIRHTIGGTSVYISKGQAYDLSERDEAIYQQFTGRNYQALAVANDLSEMTVRTIVNAGRLRDQKRRQGALSFD